MSKSIDITVNDDGSFKIEADGFQDSSCLDVLKDLENLFGKAENIVLKNEAKKHHVEARKQKV